MEFKTELINDINSRELDENQTDALINKLLEYKYDTLGKRALYYDMMQYIKDKTDLRSEKFVTGFNSIDRYAKIKRGGMTFVSAYTNHGKSLFLHNMVINQIAYYAKLGRKFKVVFFNYEDTNYDVMQHFCYLYFLRQLYLKKDTFPKSVYRYTYEEYEKRSTDKNDFIYGYDNNACAFLSQYIFTNDMEFNTDLIAIKLDKMLEDNKDILEVVIDYIQLVPCNKKTFARYLEVKDILFELKKIAKERNVAMVSACQYNQDTKYREKKSICRIANVHETKDIAKISDLFISLWNQTTWDIAEENQDIPDDMHSVEIDILKARKQNLKIGLPFLLEKNYGLINQCNNPIENKTAYKAEVDFNA